MKRFLHSVEDTTALSLYRKPPAKLRPSLAESGTDTAAAPHHPGNPATASPLQEKELMGKEADAVSRKMHRLGPGTWDISTNRH